MDLEPEQIFKEKNLKKILEPGANQQLTSSSFGHPVLDQNQV